MKVKKWHYSLMAMCVISGTLLAWQYRLHVSTQVITTEGRNNTLVVVIQELENKTAWMEEQIVALRGDLDKLQQSQSGSVDATASFQSELQRLKVLSGLTDVVGPGITIVLDDNRAGAQAAKSSANFNAENFLIHDRNVLYMVNELRRVGAEAITVNNQRIVASSDIRCVGPVIFVNSTRMAPPYIIQAIGDPEALENDITLGEELPYLKYKNFPVKLVRESEITIPAYKGSLIQNVVKPVEEGGNAQ